MQIIFSGIQVCDKRHQIKIQQTNLKYVSAGKFLIPYCFASRLSLILTKSTPKESVSSSIFSSSAKTVSHVTQLLASKMRIARHESCLKFLHKNRLEIIQQKFSAPFPCRSSRQETNFVYFVFSQCNALNVQLLIAA